MRDSIHRIVGQLKTEGIKWKPALIVDEAMFCTNAMLTINGYSPYTAVFGRAPHLLPDLNVLPDDDTLDGKSGITLRQVHRIREVAINAIMMEIAKLRISRALNAKIWNRRPASGVEPRRSSRLSP